MGSGTGFGLAAAADLEAVVAASGRGQGCHLSHRRHVGGQDFGAGSNSSLKPKAASHPRSVGYERHVYLRAQ